MPLDAKISRLVRNHQPSVIREMFQKAAAYEGVISLGIGDPDFPTPPEVCRAALADALAGHTHYTQSQGDPELLAALAGYLNERYGFGVTPAQVLVTHGGMAALAFGMQALLDPGDQVLIPEPCFPDYISHVEFAGGEVVYVPTRVTDGFLPRPAEIAARVTPRAKVLLLNSPNNPTGAVFTAEALEGLARVAREHDLVVISDEVYDRLVFEGRHLSIRNLPGMAERTIVIGSFSKSFAMTGWRVGWAVGPDWFLPHLLNVATHLTSCPNAVSQRAGIAALAQDPAGVAAMRQEFATRCRMVHQALAGLSGVTLAPPRGSFYLFPHIAGLAGQGRRFALELLDTEQVVVIPGETFGPSGRDCLRLAATVDQDHLAEALARLTRFLTQSWRA
ncbi:MAG: pyridoxal phosphate-dependent aminotransferase [Deltaproteobacteria bacterium]|nr:pyridoxal phosphate-dependent aminotransferase [Deltaproteobacteria bacterium]